VKHSITGLIRGTLAALLLQAATGATGALAAGAPPFRQSESLAREARPPASRLNVFQKRLVDRYLSGAAAATDDTLRVIVFQVQFSDSLMGGQPGSHRPEVRDSLFFTNELEHLTDYYRGASRGRLEIAWTFDPTLYTLPKEMGYYGRDAFEETRVVELAETVVGFSDPTVDFSQYDHVMIIHAGAGQETDLAGDSRGQIWSSFYDVSDIDAAFPDTTVTGLATDDSLGGRPFVVDNFSIVPANASQDFTAIGTLGIWAFEIGSRMGLLPLFDSTPNIPDSQGVGSFCVMSFGLFDVNGFIPSFPCAFNRVIAGWVDPVTVEPTETDRVVHLADINTGADTDTLCLKVPITENEYYLVVNRVHDANFDSLFTFVDRNNDLYPDNADSLGGAEFDFFLTDPTNPYVRRYLPQYGFDVLLRNTGSGIYIWHIDENVVRETIAAGYQPDDFVDRKAVDLEEADGVQDMDGGGDPRFTLGSYYDSYRTGDGNRTSFGPATDPGSSSNDGIASGIVIEVTSPPAPVMTCTVGLDRSYSDHRVRWRASTFAQPPTVVDLDGDGASEIVVAADSGRVYAFDETGAEYLDWDGDPATVRALFQMDSALVGPPAIGNVDGGSDMEMVATTTDGYVWLWQSDGSLSVLYNGLPPAAPPMLVDLLVDGEPEIAVTERDGDSLQVHFIGLGVNADPTDPAFESLWPVRVQGQYAAPLAVAATTGAFSPPKAGVVIAWVDTISAQAHVMYVPAFYPNGVSLVNEPVAKTWSATIPIPAGFRPADFALGAPAVGDVDGDGHDDVVITTPDGRLFIFANEAGETGAADQEVVTLRAAKPSAAALGDVDLDGTLEIAVWDEDFLYLLESNGRLVTDWPKRIVAESAGEQPPRTIRRGLESPVIADVDGDGSVDVLFPTLDGSVRAFGFDGRAVAGFPRVAPSGAAATPTVAPFSVGGEMSLVLVGAKSSIVRVNSVTDTFQTVDEATLSIQSLPGSDAGDRRFWSAYRNGSERHGRVVESAPHSSSSRLVDTGTFMVYPNPVSGAVVHARVILNGDARVSMTVYNLEGEETFSRAYSANPGGVFGTPFDEPIDVSGMVSGVYFLRMVVDGSRGSETMIKPFAIRR